MVSWMVNVLSQIARDISPNYEDSEKELSQLLQELYAFNASLSDSENYTDDDDEKIKKLHDVIKNISASWENISKKFLKHEMDEHECSNKKKREDNMNIEKLSGDPEKSMRIVNCIDSCSKLENEALAVTNPELKIDADKMNPIKDEIMKDKINNNININLSDDKINSNSSSKNVSSEIINNNSKNNSNDKISNSSKNNSNEKINNNSKNNNNT